MTNFDQVVKQLHDIWLNNTSEDMDVIMPLMDKIILDAKIKFSGDDPDTFYTATNTALADDYKWFYNTCYDCLDFGQEREQDDEDHAKTIASGGNIMNNGIIKLYSK